MKTLLKFSSAKCTPCKLLDELLQNIDLSNVEYQHIDIELQLDLAIKYKIRSVPTLILLEHDKELKRHIGMLTTYQLHDFVQ